MTLATYKFETIQVRTLGTAETPLFVAIDVATALGYAVPKTAVAKVVDAEDIVKAEITDSMGRTQTVLESQAFNACLCHGAFCKTIPARQTIRMSNRQPWTGTNFN